MISFEAVDEEYIPYADYYPEGKHDKISLTKIFTWVISFRRKDYVDHNITYSPYFGFGAEFEGNEEYVFLRNAYDKGLHMQHVAKTIVVHPFANSGKEMGSDRALYARAAMWKRLNGNWSYFLVFKFVFFLWRHSYITFTQIPGKIKTAFSGIKAYKLLQKKVNVDGH